jgi:hypothetical protein
LPFQREKNENFLESQSVLLKPSESLNTGPFHLFPSHLCRSRMAGDPGFPVNCPLRASLIHPRMRGFFGGMLILNVDTTIKTSELL